MIGAGPLMVIEVETSFIGMPSKSVCMSCERADRDADLADFAERALVVGVVAHQRREVEGGREAGLPVREQELEALVGLARAAEAGELAHGPQAAAVHRGVHAARVGILAGIAEVLRVLERRVVGAVERRELGARERA